MKDVGFLKLEGWKMKQSEFKSNIEGYLKNLDEVQISNFAPLDVMLKKALDGLDLHILALRNVSSPTKDGQKEILGLVIFN